MKTGWVALRAIVEAELVRFEQEFSEELDWETGASEHETEIEGVSCIDGDGNFWTVVEVVVEEGGKSISRTIWLGR